MSAVAAIDVGSNAIRLAIGSLDRSNNLTVVEKYREPIRLGQDVFTSGVISNETMERAAAAFAQFRQTIDRHAVTRIRAVGTSALREAGNQNHFIKKIEERSKIRIEVIQGTEEAQLVAEAVLSRIDLNKRLGLLIDIGGGSVEITLIKDNDVILSESVKMGTVRLLQIFGEKKQPPKVFQRLAQEYAQSLRRQLKEKLGSRKVGLCAGTGGNLDTLGELKCSVLKHTDGSFITAGELDELSSQLRAMSFQDRVEKLGLREDRADVIVPAMIVLQAILREADVEKVLIPGVGLKEGVLLEMLEDKKYHSLEAHKRQVVAYAGELSRRFHIEEEHAKTVQRISLQIFDDIKKLHNLGPEHRLILELAAMLHDIGYAINLNDHHRHGAYILRSTPFVGLTDGEKAILSSVVRYHRKGVPKADHVEYAALSKEDREVVSKLSSILRLAEALDKGHAGTVRSAAFDVKGDEAALTLRGEGELLLERWAVQQKWDFFEKVYNVRCTLTQ